MKDIIIELKKWLVLVGVVILAYWFVNNVHVILGLFVKIVKVLSPFIIGIALAYVLNIPMVKIETLLKNKLKDKETKLPIRVISITLSLLLLVLIVGFVLLLLIPELIENIELLIQNIPTLISNVENWVMNLLEQYPDIQFEISKLFDETTSLNGILVNMLNGSINIISSLVSGLITIFTSVIFAIYMLSQKEHLQETLKKFIFAYLKKQHAKKVMEIASLSNDIFSKFISGQCVEAVILGSIFFVVLSIFRFPYALIISVLTTITALIPIFGAFIAMAVGTILIGITNPFQAFIFILVFFVIQQIEGNFIYPKVVGKSVGLSPLWTLLAITIGGGLFGVVGMLIGLPIASIVYTIFTNNTDKRLYKNKTNTEKEVV